MKCYNCGEEGHGSRECPKNIGSSGGNRGTVNLLNFELSAYYTRSILYIMLHRFDILQQVGAFRLMVEGSLQEEDEEIQEVDGEIHEASAEEHQEVDSERASKQIPETPLGPGPIKRSHLMNKNLKCYITLYGFQMLVNCLPIQNVLYSLC